MKAINYILGFGGFAAAVVAAIFCAKVGHFGLVCGDIRIAAACWLGMVWFGALAVKFIGWAWSTPGGAGESGRGAAK